MKQLIWKEWREQWFLPVASAALAFLLIFAWYAQSELLRYNQAISTSETGTLVIVACLLTPLISGSYAFASEEGQGTLSFLLGLPVTSTRIWLGKVVAGLALSACGAALCTASASVVALQSSGRERAAELVSWASAHWPAMVGLILFVYFVSLTVSLVEDRSFSALLVSLVTTIGFGSAYWTLMMNSGQGPIILTSIMGVSGICGFATATFVGLAFGRSKGAVPDVWHGAGAIALWVVAGWATCTVGSKIVYRPKAAYFPASTFSHGTAVCDLGFRISGQIYVVSLDYKTSHWHDLSFTGTNEITVDNNDDTEHTRPEGVFSTLYVYYTPVGGPKIDHQVVTIRERVLSKSGKPTGASEVVGKIEINAWLLSHIWAEEQS